jgi:rhamnosyltransferase
LNDHQKSRLSGICGSLLIRENKGFDFGAWKDVILQEGWGNLVNYDSVTLMNDSCFGPLYDMENIYNRMEQGNMDFWGLTDYKTSEYGMPVTNGPIPYHIQSYFMCFNNSVIRAEIFKNFWETVCYEEHVDDIIQKYETCLTSILLKEGYKCQAFLEFDNKVEVDPTFSRPDLCILNGAPLVKIKAFSREYFPFPEDIQKLIQNKTNYPVSLIIDHFSDIYDPVISSTISDKTFSSESFSKGNLPDNLLKIAIHLHVFYMDVFEKYVAVFDNLTIKYHLFITTDTPEKKQAINNFLQNHSSYQNLEEIFVFQNHGRDILPWLSIKEKLSFYDIVGHFHTKKAPSANSYVGLSWQQEIFDLLLYPINAIIDVFNNNKKVGIIIPEIPRFFQINPVITTNDNNIKMLLNNIWQKMKCNKQIDFNKFFTFIYPYGNMFWYRPCALRPLFDLQPEDIDIPQEPLPKECVLHAIERALVYIAWSQGFDYRISVHKTSQVNSFYYNFITNYFIILHNLELKNNLENINKSLENIKGSKDYKIGKILLFAPRLIKKLFNKIKGFYI